MAVYAESPARTTITLRDAISSLLQQLLNLVTPRRDVMFTLADGSSFECPPTSDVARLLSLRNEPPPHAVLRNALRPGDTFIDIGANRGLSTMIAARAVGAGGRVIAFEPSKREATGLERNMTANRLRNVTVVRKAVAAQIGQRRFALATDGLRNSLARTQHPDQIIENWLSVELVTLDRVLSGLNGVKPRLINIDIEGAELQALQGGVNSLTAPNAPAIMVRVSDAAASAFNSSGARVYDQLKAYGYALFELRAKICKDYRVTHRPAERRVSSPNDLLLAVKDPTLLERLPN
jgi:FkbM family methyltransferase